MTSLKLTPKALFSAVMLLAFGLVAQVSADTIAFIGL